METKSKHFDMRIEPSTNRALTTLAKRKGVSKSQYLVNYIRDQAKKKGIPV